MATNFTINGVSYPFPQTGDQNWGDNVTNWAAAVSSGLLQKAGGAFTLTAEVDFGTTYGLKSAYFKSRATNPAAAGQVRLGTAEVIAWRNNANGADLPLTTDASDNLLFNGHIITGSAGVVPVASGGTGLTSYTTGDMLYASGATTLAKVGIGAVTTILGSTGTAPQWGQLVNAQVSASAAIAYSKLALTGAILNADLAGSIAYSKLVLTGAILNADLAGSIAYSKFATLNTGQFVVGSSGTATAATMGGDATVDATGSVTIGAKKVQASKLDSGVATSGFVATADGSGGVAYAVVPSAPTFSFEAQNLGISASVATNALTIALKQSDGSTDPSTGAAAVKIGFRSSTATTGGYAERSVTAALSVVVPSGTTIGTSNGALTYLYVYAIDNAGTVELGVSMYLFDEGSVQSSSAISGGSSATTLYSTTARASKAIRLIGRISISEATAGTWASAATEVSLPPFRASLAPTIQKFTSGTGTYTPTSSNILYLRVRLVGAGGGGAGSGSSGPGTGGTGTATFLSSGVLSANGGVGGAPESSGAATSTFTLTGTGVSGFTINGAQGKDGSINNTSNYHNTVPGGQGASTPFGGGGISVRGSSATSAQANTGAGGGGGNGYDTTAWQSGAGGSAGLYLEAIVTGATLAAWIASPPSYQVGVGGTAGSAGTGGVAGGVGGSGVIIIEEFYR